MHAPASGSGVGPAAAPATVRTAVSTAYPAPPGPAVAPGAAPAATPPATPAAGVPAGWHADPTQAGMQRWWDGSSWTAHTAPLPPSRPVPPVEPAYGQGAPGYGAPASGPSGHGAPGFGRLVGAVPRTVGRRGRFDVLVYERALVLARVPGIDPAWLGFGLGWVTVGGLLGYVAGDYIGAAGDDGRIQKLSALSAEQACAADRRNVLIPVTDVASACITDRGGRDGGLDVRTMSGARHRRRWTYSHVRGRNVVLVLASVLHGRAEVRSRSAAGYWLSRALLVVAALAWLVRLGLGFYGGFTSSADGGSRLDSTTRTQLAGACAQYNALVTRANAAEPPPAEQLAEGLSIVRYTFEEVAQTDPSVGPARDSLAWLQQFVVLSQEAKAAVTDAELAAHGDVVSSACGG